MSFINDREVFCLANTYGLCPPLKIGPASQRIQEAGKYEPDHNQTALSRTVVLASWVDHTNVLVRYTPADLEL